MLGAGGPGGRQLLNASAAVPFSRLNPPPWSVERATSEAKTRCVNDRLRLGWATMNMASLQTIVDHDAANVLR